MTGPPDSDSDVPHLGNRARSLPNRPSFDRVRANGVGRPREGRPPGGDRGELERELLRLENGADDVERPYLATLPEAYAGEELIFEWLGYLQEVTGLKRAMEALSYYRELGWLGDDAWATLREYLVGLEIDAEEPRDLQADDHLTSLSYVARLARIADREER